MLETILFHLLFALFFLWGFIWFLWTKNKLDGLRSHLLPAILLNNIQFPKHRSLLVRAIKILQDEISNKFNCCVEIQLEISTINAQTIPNFLLPMCYLIWEQELDNEKWFAKGEDFYTCKEFKFLFQEKNLKMLLFNFNFETMRWSVESHHAS